MLEKLDLTGN